MTREREILDKQVAKTSGPIVKVKGLDLDDMPKLACDRGYELTRHKIKGRRLHEYEFKLE